MWPSLAASCSDICMHNLQGQVSALMRCKELIIMAQEKCFMKYSVQIRALHYYFTKSRRWLIIWRKNNALRYIQYRDPRLSCTAKICLQWDYFHMDYMLYTSFRERGWCKDAKTSLRPDKFQVSPREAKPSVLQTNDVRNAALRQWLIFQRLGFNFIGLQLMISNF